MVKVKRYRGIPSSPVPIFDQVSALTDNVLMCRDLRHAWGVDIPFHDVKVQGGPRGAQYTERTLGCLRCDSQRLEIYRIHTEWLERLRVSYKYPENYHIRGAKRSDNVQGRVREELRRRGLTTGRAA